MIVVGFVAAVAAGVALPVHMLLFGRVINQFVYFTRARELTDNVTMRALSRNMSCDAFIGNITQSQNVFGMGTMGANDTVPGNNSLGLFCEGQSSSVFSNVAAYICDPAGMLTHEISQFSLYYVALASGVLLASFVATMLWNVSGYRQSHKMRVAFYRSILRQEMGWFDVSDAAQLNNRLQE